MSETGNKRMKVWEHPHCVTPPRQLWKNPFAFSDTTIQRVPHEDDVIQSNPCHPEGRPPFLADNSVIYRDGDKMVFEIFLDGDRLKQINAGTLTRIPELQPCAPGLIRPELFFSGYLPIENATPFSSVAIQHYKMAQRNADVKGSESELGNAVQLVVVKLSFKDLVTSLWLGNIVLDPRFDGINFLKPLLMTTYGESFELLQYDLEPIDPEKD